MGLTCDVDWAWKRTTDRGWLGFVCVVRCLRARLRNYCILFSTVRGVNFFHSFLVLQVPTRFNSRRNKVETLLLLLLVPCSYTDWGGSVLNNRWTSSETCAYLHSISKASHEAIWLSFFFFTFSTLIALFCAAVLVVISKLHVGGNCWSTECWIHYFRSVAVLPLYVKEYCGNIKGSRIDRIGKEEREKKLRGRFE